MQREQIDYERASCCWFLVRFRAGATQQVTTEIVPLRRFVAKQASTVLALF